MGRVYLARDLVLDREVAIKFLRVADPSEHRRRRFLFEGRALARLHHPNIVVPLRAGEVEGQPYLVSEFVPGVPLDQLPRPVPPALLRELARGLARALAATHRSGFAHRDVKPANVILSHAGEVKLIDFGIATLLGRADDELPVRPAAAGQTEAETAEGAVVRTRAGAVVGTPRYLAPERLAGAPGSVESDLYSFGLVLQELVGDEPSAGALAPLISRCLRHAPEERFHSADEVLAALDGLEDAGAPLVIPPGNPYRGLAPFEAGDASLFVGRRSEIRAVSERLAYERVVIVAGDSGVGKSSLCRAGVVPRMTAEGALVVVMTPGSAPLQRFIALLAQALSRDVAGLATELRDVVSDGARSLWATLAARRLVVFVDQLEELCTQAPEAEVEPFTRVVAALLAASPRFHLLAATRGDFLARLAQLPHLGAELPRALFLLRPLSPEQLREVIVTPAERAGATFETQETVRALVASATGADGALPLLQFTLAELWDERDRATQVIPHRALAALGGMDGALERHANSVFESLDPPQRDRARRLLLRLITPAGTRARLSAAEVEALDAEDRHVLEQLVRARLVSVQSGPEWVAWELIHEALIARWSRLRTWLAETAAQREHLERLRLASAEWERLGRPSRLTWTRRQLEELDRLDAKDVSPVARAFMTASRQTVRRAAWLRWSLPLTALVLLLLVVMAVLGAVRARVRASAAERLELATRAATKGRQAAAEGGALRTRAYALFDAASSPDRGAATWAEAERLWTSALEQQAAAELAFSEAEAALQAATFLDPERSLAPTLALAVEQLALAQSMHRVELVSRLELRLRVLQEGQVEPPRPGQLRLAKTSGVTDVQVLAVTPEPDGRLAMQPVTGPELPAGMYVLRWRAEEAVFQRPFEVRAGAETLVSLEAPPVPSGMVWIAAGESLLGCSEPETMRKAFLTAPLHAVAVEGFFIGRNEVTFAEYVEWLEKLPREERLRRQPGLASHEGALELSQVGGVWTLRLKPTVTESTARWGEPLLIAGRRARQAQDWRRFPVTAISYDDAQAYVGWLASTRLPGARLCTEQEWERAARGIDGRVFTTGATLRPGDTNIDLTYERKGFGPDEVGSHPESTSPWGVEDMEGNALEMLRSFREGEVTMARGGSWYYESMSARLDIRYPIEPNTRSVFMGFRVCADVR